MSAHQNTSQIFAHWLYSAAFREREPYKNTDSLIDKNQGTATPCFSCDGSAALLQNTAADGTFILPRIWHANSSIENMKKNNPLLKICMLIFVAGSACLITGCRNMDDRTVRNTGVGTAAGAVLGGVIGHQSGETAEGAALGAAIGGAGGYGYSKATEEKE